MMKKIRAIHSDKDRVICVATSGKLDFYYQPVRDTACMWLHQILFSGSVFAYFRNHGCNMNSYGYSLTIGELYKFSDYKNPKLSRLFSRLPSIIDYVITYEFQQIHEGQIMKCLNNTSIKQFIKQPYYVNYDGGAA